MWLKMNKIDENSYPKCRPPHAFQPSIFMINRQLEELIGGDSRVFLESSGLSTLETAQFLFAEPEVVSYLVQQGGADLAAHVRLTSRNGFDVSLVQKDVVGWAGIENALRRPRDAVKEAQQYSLVLNSGRRQVFHDDGDVDEPLAKGRGQIIQSLRHKSLKLVSLHLTPDCNV